MEDKRRHLRVPVRVHVSCELEGDVVFDAVATDICLGGSRIESPQSPGFGSRLTIVTQLPGCSERSRLPATVRWTQSGAFGVQFGLLGARDTYRIADLMSKAMRSFEPS